MENFEKIISERGKPLLIHNGHKFYKSRMVKSTGETCWKCYKKNCYMKFFTIGDDVFSKTSGEHNHGQVHVSDLNRQKINNKLKRKILENDTNLTERPAKLIYSELISQDSTMSTLTTKDIKKIRNNLSYTKQKLMQRLPWSVSEVHKFLNSQDILTNLNENFLLSNNSEDNIVVFSCENNVKFMCNQETLYMDGTDDYCTKYFLQLFTINAYSNDIYIPVAFCLLPNKEKQTYIKLFKSLKQSCSQNGCSLNMKTVVVDFEQAIHSSLLECFPDVTIVGCSFHFAQSWWGKIQRLGLSIDYEDAESATGKWIRCLFGLLSLCPEEVGDAFAINFSSCSEKVTQFANYLIKSYIEENSTFPTSICAAHTASLSRSTNTWESFHSKFNSYCGGPHPNLYIFIEALKKIQCDTYIKINTAKNHLSTKAH